MPIGLGRKNWRGRFRGITLGEIKKCLVMALFRRSLKVGSQIKTLFLITTIIKELIC